MRDWPGQVCVHCVYGISVCVRAPITQQHALCLSLQMLLTASQIQWTTDVTRALMTSKERADKSALKSLKKKQVKGAEHLQVWTSDSQVTGSNT